VLTRDGYQFFETKIPGGRYLYCPHPLIADAANFLSLITTLAQEEGAWFVRVEPYVGSAPIATNGAVSVKPTLALQPGHTLEVPLADNESMLAAMHQKTRYNIRQAEKAGVSIRFDQSEEAVTALLGLLEQTSERANIRLHPSTYYPTMLRELGGAVGESGRLRVEVALAEYHGQPVAGALLAWWGTTCIYLHGGSNYEQRSLMAPHLLHWTAMQRARDAGCATYDMGGVAPEDEPNHAWAGISRFKRGFGGQTISYPSAVDVVLRPFAYQTYTLGRTLRRIVG